MLPTPSDGIWKSLRSFTGRDFYNKKVFDDLNDCPDCEFGTTYPAPNDPTLMRCALCGFIYKKEPQQP